MRMRDPNEPTVHHAADGRHALMYVTRDARLVLMYQNEATWHSTSARLATINSSHDLLSHAAMGPEAATMLVVTQKIRTARGADRILLIDAGKVVAYGTHEDLLQTSALYKKIAISQQEVEE